MDKLLNVLLQLPADTEANWAAKNPVVPEKLTVYSSDQFAQFKIGDGKSTWSQLPYNRASTPYPLILKLNGTVAATHYGTASSTVNITAASIGAATTTHNHSKSQITDFPAALKNPAALTISLNGSSQGAYDGAAAKAINITPALIGAAPAAGSASIAKLGTTVTLGNGDAASIFQNGGAYQQKINIIDNSSANDAVFQFQQSSDSGSTFKTLMEIRDDGNIVATKFTGSLAGNSLTTNKLITARKIGNALFDGSKDITLAEIGAAASSHSHSYLPLGGGTLTGALSFNGALSINYRLPTQPAGGHANGLSYQNYGDAKFGGIGAIGNKGTYEALYLGFGDSPWASANSLYITNTEMKFKNNKVWHAGNDGAGSGLDADLLDGKQASSFALSSHSHPYLPLSGGTMSGNISYTMFGSTQIPLKAYGGDSYGMGISLGAGGSTIVGSGESAKACESLLAATTEQLWLASDSNICFYTHCDTIGNKAGVILDTSRAFYPDTNNTGTLGTSSHKWSNVFAAAFTGTLSGNASTATKLQTARTLTIGNSGKNFDGTANVTWTLAELGAAPVNHASTGTSYGIATASAYGHMKATNGNGLTLSSGTLSMGAASASAAGAVTIGTQTFAGMKTFSGITTISNTTASTSKSTGAFKVSGGVGIAGQMSSDKVRIGDGVTLEYSDGALNFIFI